MAWGDNGVTTKRILLDQQQAVTVGASSIRLATQSFNQVGYLRDIWFKIPYAAGSVSLATSGMSAQAEDQSPSLRLIQNLSIVAQGIAPLYQLSRGIDVRYLEYAQNGRKNTQAGPTLASLKANQGTAPTVPSPQLYGAGGAVPGYSIKNASVGAFAAGAQPVAYALTIELPLTEWVKFPATVVKGANGAAVQVAAQEVEVGLVTLQNTQQNIMPTMTLNPLGSASSSPEQVFISGGGPITAGLPIAPSWYTEFYDVPGDPASQPPPYSQMFVVTRQSVDDPVSGGKVTHRFQPAGLLMKSIYVFLDTNGKVVDLTNAGASDPQVTFLWGATVDKIVEPLSLNVPRCFQDYNELPPAGCFIHDFFVDRTLTDLPNTAALTSVQAQFVGLPANVTTLHTIEVRLLPVRLRG